MTAITRRTSWVSVGAMLAIGLLGLAGCDTDSADAPVSVNPSVVTLTLGQSVEFTASGGYDYTWSLDPDDGSGRLSAVTGPSVVYTCLATNVGTAPKKVVVTSTIEGTSSASLTVANTNVAPIRAYSVQGSAEIFYGN